MSRNEQELFLENQSDEDLYNVVDRETLKQVLYACFGCVGRILVYRPVEGDCLVANFMLH
jgi:hypothetical protein